MNGGDELGAMKCEKIRPVEKLDEGQVNLALDAYRDGSGGQRLVVLLNA